MSPPALDSDVVGGAVLMLWRRQGTLRRASVAVAMVSAESAGSCPAQLAMMVVHHTGVVAVPATFASAVAEVLRHAPAGSIVGANYGKPQ